MRGYTLVELMVALVVGLLVVLTVGQSFLLNSRSFDVQQSQSGLQQRARFAAIQIERVVSAAGFQAQAVAQKGQTADDCRKLTIDELGRKQAFDAQGNRIDDRCW